MGIDSRHIPNRLRWYRELEGFSQKDVAKLLGFKTSAVISEWETSSTYPSLPYILKLSILYRTLPAELFCDLYDVYRKEILAARKQFDEMKSLQHSSKDRDHTQ